MSLQIYISHTGQRLQADPNQLVSPDALRQWISETTAIPALRQILMTARGKNVKQQHLSTESEVFVYDKEYFTGDLRPPSSSNRPKPTLRRLRDPPSTITNENSLQSWQGLFMARRAWALEAADIVRSGAESAQVYNDEIDVIARSTSVALDNLKNHVSTLQHKFENTQKWASDALEEHRAALNDWKAGLEVLGEVPVREDMVGILQTPSTPTKNNAKRIPASSLQDLVDSEHIEDGAKDLAKASTAFEQKLKQLQEQMKSFIEETMDVQKYGQSSWAGSETANNLIEESETLAKKVSSDYEEVLRFQNNQKSVATASRRALVHTRDFLPALKAIIDEVHQLQTSSVIRRNEMSENCLQALRGVSSLESRLAGLQGQVTGLELDAQGTECLDTINRTFQLPVVYGSVLVEAVRRSNWVKQVKDDMERMREDVQSVKEDELRRRKKWVKSMGDFFHGRDQEESLLDTGFPGPESTWPEAAKDEVIAYIEDLKALRLDGEAQEVTIMLNTLETSGKPRKRSVKAFKNGSVYDISNSSMLPANGELVKVLQDDKVRLEDKLRASDSRIRKLEDLLHRQSQIVRPSSVTFGSFPDFERQSSSPSPIPGSRPTEILSRKSSTTSRRLSNQKPDEKELVQRIMGLEGEIMRLKQEAHDERRSSTESKGKMEEAESIKRDLMANFESQKQEFDDERQLLEDEAQKLKIRIEELEDELDRVAGSRDHQRITTEKTIAGLHTEAERLRRAAEEQSTKARNRYETIESMLGTQRDRAMSLEKQVQQHKEERSSLQAQNLALANQLRDAEQEQQDHIGSLQAAHSNLSPSGSAPDDFKKLVRALEILSEGSAIHVRGQDDAIQLATAEIRSLEERIHHAESQTKSLEGRLKSEEAASSSLREFLARERSKLDSLQRELADEQAELKSLRTKFAAGETGSEALRERLVDEETKVAELSQRAAVAEANAENAALELKKMKAKADASTEREQDLVSHLDARGLKAKELSQRLFQHNDRMVRMLEQLGYSVTRQDDKLAIQRASRMNASTTLAPSTFADVSLTMKRTISGTSPTQHYSDTSDLDTLYWMSDSDARGEDAKFQAFISTLSRLDLDATVELIAKRYKDVETLAKKFQKDYRGYREKSHRIQSEAHDKIAYRSFKEGDLALFLPTRNQATRPWAAFNVGAPHYFLREQDAHKLQSREWLLARISKVEERMVDLSRSLGSNRGQPDRDRASLNTEASDGASTRSIDDENPFELSDGLRWYMIDASEEKPGAPTTPGLGKSTVAASNVEVKGSMGKKVEKNGAAGNAATMVTKTLNKSLDSRRSSSGSKKGHTPSPSISSAPLLAVTNEGNMEVRPMVKHADTDLRSDQPAREDAQVFEDGRHKSKAEFRTENERVFLLPRKEAGSSTASRHQTPSPVKKQERTASPVKVSTPAKQRPWDKIWGIEYNSEDARR